MYGLWQSEKLGRNTLQWSNAGGFAIAVLFAVAAGPAAASAEEARTCSAWRSGGKGYEQIELRTCTRTESDASANADDKDDETAYDVELKSGYDKPIDVRIELTAADGTVENLDVEVKSGPQVAGECSVCADHGDVKKFRIAKSSAGKDEPLEKIAGNMYMEVLARDLRLTDSNAQKLKRIAARYFKATKSRLVVTGGTRPPARQAQLMYDKLVHGDDVLAIYENKAAAMEVRNAYRDAVAKKLKRKATIRALKEVIEAQMARSVYVSKHLRSGAVDVRSWNMKGKLEKALRDAVKQEPGVTMMDERDGAEPHFHLNLL